MKITPENKDNIIEAIQQYYMSAGFPEDRIEAELKDITDERLLELYKEATGK